MSLFYFLILKSEIIPTKQNSSKYINNDNMDDKLALVKSKFVTRFRVGVCCIELVSK